MAGTAALPAVGVPTTVPDHAPSSLPRTARTCTSYEVPLVSPEMVSDNPPDPEVTASSTTVQFASVLSDALLAMCRTSYAVTASSSSAVQPTMSLASSGVTDAMAGTSSLDEWP